MTRTTVVLSLLLAASASCVVLHGIRHEDNDMLTAQVYIEASYDDVWQRFTSARWPVEES